MRDVARVSPAQSLRWQPSHPQYSSTSDSSICRRPNDVSTTRVWYIRGYRISAGHGGRLTWHTSSVLG